MALFTTIACLCLMSFGDTTENPNDLKTTVSAPPKKLHLDPFYKKYLDADGIAVISSEKVADQALVAARELVIKMLSKRDDIRKVMVTNRARLAILAVSEVTTDIPEYRQLQSRDLSKHADGRALNELRGLGGNAGKPVSCVGEENLLGYPEDKYRGESLLIHEFAHAICGIGIRSRNGSGRFMRDLKQAYENAIKAGLWKDTYAATDLDEYWAVGAEVWFDAKRTSHEINTREQLKKHDPDLAALLAQVFPDDEWRFCYPEQLDKDGLVITRGIVKLTIINNTKHQALIYWINKGNPVFYCKLEPSGSYEQSTYASHQWRALVGGDGNQFDYVAPAQDATWKLE